MMRRTNFLTERGRLLELPILLAFVGLVAGGLAVFGFHWKALAMVGGVIGGLFAVAFVASGLGLAGEKLATRRVRRDFTRLLASPSSGSVAILERIREEGYVAVRDGALGVPGVLEAAVAPGPLRAGLFNLLVYHTDDSVAEKLRPAVRANLATAEVLQFEAILHLFLYQEGAPEVMRELLPRAGESTRRALLSRIAGSYTVEAISKKDGEWTRRWAPVIAPWREDLLAIRDRVYIADRPGVEALLLAAESGPA